MRISDWSSDVCSSDLRMVSALVPVARASSPIRIAWPCSCYKVHMYLRLERCKESGMGKSCCQTPEPDQSAHNNPRWRMILWIALIANAAMFVVEIVAGVEIGREHV